jgi:hypothetical protein
MKIYSPFVLPDIDVFTPKNENVARDLFRHLKDKGYTINTYYGKALHEDTITVYSMGLKVADITYLKPEMMRILRGPQIGPLPLVSSVFLQLTMHGMMAIESVDRWVKAYDRLMLHYKLHPPEPADINSIVAGDDKMYREIEKYLEQSDCVLAGASTVAKMMQQPSITRFKGIAPIIGLVDDNPEIYAKKLVATLSDYHLEVSKKHKSMSVIFQNDYVVVRRKESIVCIIFAAKSFCFGYVEYRKVKHASINTAIMLYLSMYLSPDSCFKSKHTLKVIADNLAAAFTQHQRRKLMRYTTLQCIGKQDGLATLRRKRKMS